MDLTGLRSWRLNLRLPVQLEIKGGGGYPGKEVVMEKGAHFCINIHLKFLADTKIMNELSVTSSRSQ